MQPWLPHGTRAAVTLSVDDVHPASSRPGADADLARPGLDLLQRLQDRHPALKATFFTTPDWRSKSLEPNGPLLPRDTYRLSRHPSFCALLRNWPGVELALHGLHHVAPGPHPEREMEGRTVRSSRALLERAMALFAEADLPFARGLCPPGWAAPPALLRAMSGLGLHFLASARDLDTPPTRDACANGSGLRGVPLFAPAILPGTEIVHLPTNFQATSSLERAREILATGGLLSIKAHLLDGLGAYRALDGLTPGYIEHLDSVLSAIENEFGDSLWWAPMGAVASRLHETSGPAGGRA